MCEERGFKIADGSKYRMSEGWATPPDQLKLEPAGPMESYIMISHESPPYRSELRPIGDGVVYSLARKRPNFWWRMWQYLLLGWKWKSLETK